jgi:hypothetical protein
MTFGDSKYDSFGTSKNPNPRHKIKNNTKLNVQMKLA